MTPVPFAFHITYSPSVPYLLPFSYFLVCLSTPMLVFLTNLLRDIWMCCGQIDVECDSGRCLLSGQPGAVSLLHDSLQVAKHQIFSPGCCHVRLMALKVVCCLWPHVVRASLGLRLKVDYQSVSENKNPELIILSMRKMYVFRKWQMMVCLVSCHLLHYVTVVV